MNGNVHGKPKMEECPTALPESARWGESSVLTYQQRTPGIDGEWFDFKCQNCRFQDQKEK